MLLTKYQGDHYKCIENTNEIQVHKKITRLVGQNEAGKTALLELLAVLRPISNTPTTFQLEDYPRSKFNQYKKIHDSTPHTPVRAEFQLDSDELKEIEEKYGSGVLNSPTITLSKKYGQKQLWYTLGVNEAAYLKSFLANAALDSDVKTLLKKAKTIKEMKEEISKLGEDKREVANTLPENLSQEIFNSLSIPYFFYFDEYASLPGAISLKKLKQFSETENYSGADADSMMTAKALVDFAGAEIDEFLNKDNYERLTADLEAASNEITDQLRRFWTTNKNLEIRFVLEPVLNQNSQLVDTTLHVRVYNTKHRVTVPFEKRSKGFVWFFSFLVAFSAHKDRDEKLVLLLDEPGTNLGAVAQRDLMRYFEDQLTPHHQVIYTTHSPFMIDVRQLDTVRTVEDEESTGTKVSNDPYRHSSQTLFPLQAALGYDLGQSLFVAPNNLLVEGPADLIYINLATQILAQEKRTSLSDEWTIVPVGGADKIATFVSLLGAQGLNLAVFMDITSGDSQRIQSILKNKLMLKKSLVTVGSILQKDEADIEDLFSPQSFLKLINRSYAHELSGKTISENDLKDSSPRIAKKLATYFLENKINNGKFNHYKPAFDLMNHPEWIAEIFDAQTKTNFEKSFVALNAALDNESNQEAMESLPVKKLKRANAQVDFEANA